MKKNKMMRLASCLLVMVLLTTSMISGTFAKYVTSAEGSDSARVAKFGVAITANGETFAKEYNTHDNAYTETKSVISTEKVVAPGTSGDMAKMTLSGTPEVAVRVSYAGAFDISDNWTVDGEFYCPLVIKVDTTTIKGTEYESAAEFEAAVNAAIAKYTVDFGPNTDLAGDDVKGCALAISWEWPFSVEGNDAKDTWLGNQAVAGNPATVTLKVTTTVTQID